MAEIPQGNNVITWRALNREGCEKGRAIRKELDTMTGSMDKMQAKIDKILWALVVSAIGLAVSAVGLLLNLAV